MTRMEQVDSHLREAERALKAARHSAKKRDDPAQVQRYIKDAQDRLGRADAVAEVHRLALLGGGK